MDIDIKIDLGSRDVGTRAKVTTKRFLRKPVTDTYLCHKAGKIMGGEWVNEVTGVPATSIISSMLNDSAQAAANLARFG